MQGIGWVANNYLASGQYMEALKIFRILEKKYGPGIFSYNIRICEENLSMQGGGCNGSDDACMLSVDEAYDLLRVIAQGTMKAYGDANGYVSSAEKRFSISRMIRPRPDRFHADLWPISADPLVSIIMTAYNAEETIEGAVQSILNQTYKNIELIIIDDASSDRTVEVASMLATLDDRIRVLEGVVNRGTYWRKNEGIIAASGELVSFMDSDDRSLPDRIEKQVGALLSKKAVASMCLYVRKDARGDIVPNRGVVAREALMGLLLRRAAVLDVGYFDTVRTSADSEFLDRLRLVYGNDRVVVVAEPLYEALIRENSLTNQQNNTVSLDDNAGLFLSPARYMYQENYRRWHADVKKNGFIPKISFPVTDRPFKVAAPLKVDLVRFDSDPVLAFMASFPPRLNQLKVSVASLVDQVDHLYIYLNGYKEIPDFLIHPKITALPAHDSEDLRDVGKLYHMQMARNGYYLTVDDDIVYPPDYAESMIRAIENYDRGALVGVHGVIFETPITRYFSKNRIVFHFAAEQPDDKVVNLLGTGTMGFHSSTIVLCHAYMPKGMLDIGVAVAARRAGVPMVSIARPKAWLKPVVIDQPIGATLYEEFRENDSAQTELLKMIHDWTPIRPSKDLRTLSRCP